MSVEKHSSHGDTQVNKLNILHIHGLIYNLINGSLTGYLQIIFLPFALA